MILEAILLNSDALKRTRLVFILHLLLFLLLLSAHGQEAYRHIDNKAFDAGERLKWRIFYDSWLVDMVAGYGEVEVKNSHIPINGRKVYHIDASGYSAGLFNIFFKVRDKFDSYIDKEFIAPHYFVRRTREGGYKKNDEYHFNQLDNYVMSRTDTVDTPPYIHDFISAIYYTRTFESDTFKVGDRIPFTFFLDDSVYISSMLFEGRETIEIKLGTFRCLRLKPGMATGDIFSKKFPMTVWVTDDENHIPVYAESAVVVGNVQMELVEYSGLKNPLRSKIEQHE